MCPFDTDDLPATQPLFAFGRLASTLTSVLQRDRGAAFVLGLLGPWGSGKTTLLQAIRTQLPAAAIVIEFNAWKYQNKESLWRALILRVLASVRENGGDGKQLDELERSLYEGFTATDQGPLQINWTAAATEALQMTISLAAIGVGGGLLGGLALGVGKFLGQKKDGDGKAEDSAKRIERAAGILRRKTIERAVHHVVSIEQFVGDFQKVVASLGTTRRIYVLIDDLDRCLPEAALEIFEAMKLFLDSPQCAYVVAVDRAVIRRGLELRYPARSQSDARALPPTVDPDEYIEKTITLSVDMPILAEADGRALLSVVDDSETFSPEEANAIITVLGTNPRRLKRFGTMLALWRQVARSLRDEDRVVLRYSPLDDDNRALFVKLGLIGYLNSAVLAQMQRDPGLPVRLQETCNGAFGPNGQLKPEAAADIAKAVGSELPVIAQASLDPALWRALRMQPLLTVVTDKLPDALRWFRSAA
jgi:hypothetical protein